MLDRSDQSGNSSPNAGLRGRRALLATHHWLTFLLPFLVYMLVGSLEPTPDKLGGQDIGLAIPYAYYPAIYVAKIGLTIAAMLFVWPGYRQFAPRITLLGIAVGVVGVVVWVGLCRLDLEHRLLLPLLKPVGLGGLIAAGTRSAFDPFQQFAGRPVEAWGFLAVRFLGLAAVVPVIEEFFLRGFVMRLVVAQQWWKLPIGRVNTAAILLGTLVPMTMHPGELLATAVWFSMVTWLMVKTQSLWDCVAAHAITNLLLGIYVVTTGDWRLM